MAKTYSLNDMGVTADDLIMLNAAGISFDETDNISEEKRDEILSELYKLKQKAKENTKAPEDKNKEIEPATAEQIRDMNRRLKNGEHLSANEVASAVAAGGIVSKDMRAEIKNTVVNFANSENADQEDARAVAYLLDELDGKHVDDQKNRHSVEEYKKQFNDNPEILEAASKKLEAVNNAPTTAAKTYSKEDIDGMMKAADVYLKAPDEVDNHEILEKANPKYKETHAQLFEDQLKEIQDVIRDYGEGKADISPEAAESMQKLINLVSEDVVEQTQKAFENIGVLLEASGLTYDDIVKTTVLLDDMNDFAKVNEEYAKYFDGIYPARSCFEVAKLPKSAKVEIECVAIKK